MKKILALEGRYCYHTSFSSHTLVQLKFQILCNVALCHWVSSFDSMTNCRAFFFKVQEEHENKNKLANYYPLTADF